MGINTQMMLWKKGQEKENEGSRMEGGEEEKDN